MAYHTIYISKEIVDRINEDIKKIKYDVSFSNWVKQACLEKLNDNTAKKNIIKWYRSFPREPIKNLIERL